MRRFAVSLVVVAAACLSVAAAPAGIGSFVDTTDFAPRLSPDGTHLAFLRIEHGFYGGAPRPDVVVGAVDDSDTTVVGGAVEGFGQDNLAWLPDGSELLFQGGGTVYAVAPDGSRRRALVDGYLDRARTPVAPDGSAVAVVETNDFYGSNNGSSSLIVVSLRSGDSHVVRTAPDRIWSASFSPDGQRLAFLERGDVYVVASDATGLVDVGPDAHAAGYYSSGPAWSPDGRWIAYVGDANLVIASSDGSERRVLATDAYAIGGALAWSPAGDRILFPTSTGYAVVPVSEPGAEQYIALATAVGGRGASWKAASRVVVNGIVNDCGRDGVLEVTPVTDPIAQSRQPLTNDCRIFGSTAPDVIHGTVDRDVIFGLGGNDRLYGDVGRDVIYGGRGDDYLDSERQGGTLSGQDGSDVLVAHSGNDRLFGGRGNDRLTGGRGEDTLIGGPGRDVLLGGSQPDRIDAVDGFRDVVDCGDGDDSAVVDRIDVVHHCNHVTRR